MRCLESAFSNVSKPSASFVQMPTSQWKAVPYKCNLLYIPGPSCPPFNLWPPTETWLGDRGRGTGNVSYVTHCGKSPAISIIPHYRPRFCFLEILPCSHIFISLQAVLYK